MTRCEKPTLAWLDFRHLTKNNKPSLVWSAKEVMKHTTLFNESGVPYSRNYIPIDVACGKCILCRKRRSFELAVRALCESREYDSLSCSFVTLTVSDENMPVVFPGGRLQHKPFQDFMKRVRKAGHNVRYLMCGEYGENTHRPHYHVILFGWQPRDGYFDKLGCWHASKELEELWKFGLITCEPLNDNRIMYVSGYTMKSVGDDYKSYARWSRRPGLGASFLDKHWKEIYYKDVLFPQTVDRSHLKLISHCRRIVIGKSLVDFGCRYFDDRLSNIDVNFYRELCAARFRRLKVEPLLSAPPLPFDAGKAAGVLRRRQEMKLRDIQPTRLDIDIKF